ncbi:hypothetical protein CALCODRAFT_273703 [Calocera cornea HHB12733]|uniref:NAD(P)-binding domain-containing protein n=1 Tax=Calocera cornea HHB12733 TaxID=1353952 RepID=A0A166JGJ0_9BASI|nr:hypothetical protein CALCODRAFT_273703 [Calocera cornea HHB12733]
MRIRPDGTVYLFISWQSDALSARLSWLDIRSTLKLAHHLARSHGLFTAIKTPDRSSTGRSSRKSPLTSGEHHLGRLSHPYFSMHVLVIGASGRTGSLVVSEALRRKDRVTALVRIPDKLHPAGINLGDPLLNRGERDSCRQGRSEERLFG